MLGVPVFPSSPAFPIEGGGVTSTIIGIIAALVVAAVVVVYWAMSRRAHAPGAVVEFPVPGRKAA